MSEPAKREAEPAVASWDIADAAELYQFDVWSDGFFVINDKGHVAVQATPDAKVPIDIPQVVADLQSRGVKFPVLLRFQDVLRERVRRINEAFRTAITEQNYGAEYRGVYPIKVNQLHEVVEEVLDAGRQYKLGLECGSKAELVASLAHLVDDDMMLIANGVKDESMLSLIHSAQRLGKNVIPVIEKYGEFEQWMKITENSDCLPAFGARIRLTTTGSGRWEASGGDQSKFGISIQELVDMLGRLEAAGRKNAFALLHFHLGSQLADVSVLRQGLKEITQVYAKLHRRGFPVRYLDVGGGLGVRYHAATGEEANEISYTLQEYANTVVSSVAETCDEQEVAHPTLITESGRAITAHHSVLVVEALGAFRKPRIPKGFKLPESVEMPLRKLDKILRRARGKHKDPKSAVSTLVEAYHGARDTRSEAEQLFRMGFLPLEEQGIAECLYWSVLEAVADGLNALEPDPTPPELYEVEEQLVEQYLCDFSIFQSMLDHWAIRQPFPIVPIDRLDERPTRRAMLVDLTCDSDGKVSQYVTSNEDTSYIQLHPIAEGEKYCLGLFLMGAYQDIMGDTHNLFGRVAEAHIYADAEEPNGYWVEKIIPATRVQDMLEQVQYFPRDLERRMNEIVRRKIDEGALRPNAGMEILEEYTRMFSHSTYCEPGLPNGKARQG